MSKKKSGKKNMRASRDFQRDAYNRSKLVTYRQQQQTAPAVIEKPWLKVAKAIGMGLAGWIVYRCFQYIFPMFISDSVLASMCAAICFIIFGGLYYISVLGKFGERMQLNAGFNAVAGVTMVVFSFTVVFVTGFITSMVNDTGMINRMDALVSMSDEQRTMYFISSILFVPVAEEIAYRGFMFRFFSKVNKLFAYIAVPVIFGLAHGTISHLYAAIIGGFILCFIYDRTHNILLSSAAHIIYNASQVVFALFTYPDMMFTPLMIVIFNLIVFALLFLLSRFKIEPVDKTGKTVRKVLTESERKEKERIRKIVEEVTNESKK